MTARPFSTLWIRMACLFCISLFVVGGCKATRVTQAEVEQRISKDIPIGSQKEQVIAFINSLVIGGLKAENHGYIPDVASEQIPWEGPAVVTGGHIFATIRNAARDHTKLQVYSINMDFRFDDKERLIDYKVQTQGDW